jgi:hypothetical protein
VKLRFELRALKLANQKLNCVSHTCSPFYSGNFGGGDLSNYLHRLASPSQLPKELGFQA